MHDKPTLFLMLGYPGAGKTTVAKIVCDITGAEHLWADFERKLLFGEPSYSQEENDTIYDSLNERAKSLLGSGRSVMYDTAFNHYGDRKKLEEIATASGADTILLWVQAPKEVAKERAVERRDHQPTRVLNDSTPMHVDHFEYLSDKLEEPMPNEKFIKIDGTKVTKDYIKSKLNEV